VKLKLDENLGRRCTDLLVAAGHDVAMVADQRMTSASDEELIRVCAGEGRALVTLDLDFSNPLVFPPQRYAGIAVLRLPSKASYASLVAVVKTLVDALQREPLAGRLWSVEGGRIRVYQPPDAED
jgi:predicted nuclease of predicted toxin-antitoxin system